MKHLPTTEIIENIIAKYILDRREQTCYTIDNNDTIEFDDAFSLWNETKEDGKEYQTLKYIYQMIIHFGWKNLNCGMHSHKECNHIFPMTRFGQ